MGPKPLFALLAVTITVPVMAQGDARCDLADTPAECWNRFVPALPAVMATEESATKKSVSTANTGSTQSCPR